MNTDSITFFATELTVYQKFKSIIETSSKWMLLCDKNTYDKCSAIFLDRLGLQPDFIFSIEAGESNKNLGQVEEVYDALLKANFDRQSMIVNLGGGMVSDLGGFVASTYKRGIDFINVPTTLLSMVDAAYGGKTGVNFKGIKNQIGCFNQPKLVLTDVNFLQTLQNEELLSGFAEMLKHALISNENQWEKLKELKSLNSDVLSEEMIKSSISIKQDIVEKDPLERLDRKKLNFGHTIGHAIESFLTHNGSDITHGRAIAAGMICETKLSFSIGLKPEESDEIIRHLDTIYGRLEIEKSAISKLIELMFFDKKNSNNTLNFTLLTSIGNSVIDQELKPEEVERCLVEYIQGR